MALSNSSFNNIVAMNGMWVKDDASLQQVDWVKILTHSIYNIWEAEGKGDFNSNSLVMERNSLITNEFSDGNVKGVKVFSGLDSNSTEQEIFAIRGPFVYQDRNYKVTHRLANEAIPYRVNFRLKLGIKPETNMPICSLKVRVIYNDNYGTQCTTLLASRLIYSNELNDVEYENFDLDYVLDNLPVFYPDSASGHFPTQNVGYRIVDYSTTKVFYEVDIPQGVDLGILEGLYIDNVKVTDGDIWESHGKNYMYDRLDSYDQIWTSTEVNSLYQNKIKFFYTLDEPHAYDRFHPYRLVESYMNSMSQFNNKFMLTKIYPEWSGEKEGLNVIRTWNNIVNPKKMMFWYYTVFNNNPGTILTHSQLRTRLQEVNEKYDDFYYTAQTFGARRLSSIGNPNPTNSDYHYYRTPTGSEVLGQTIQALAYGCKGIFYETYYSYKSWYTDWGEYFAEGLVGQNLIQHNVPRENDFGLYDTIKSIGKRLKGTLGKHLLQLQYTKNDACIAYHKDSDPLPYKDTASISEFTIFDDNLPEYPLGTHYFNVGFTKFKPKQTSPLKGDYYFLLNINSWDIAEPDSEVFLPTYNNLHVGIRATGYKNWRFYDIEGGNDFRFENNSSGFDFTSIIPIGKGDGRLFRLIPTSASTGTFLTDEIITSGEIISSEGTIKVPTGVTLKIEGNYTLTDSLIIEDGGVLTLEPGSTLNLDSASSVYCAGDIYINGTETNKVTINFLQPNETKQNSIYLGNGSSAIIKYAQIKNGYSGITATNGFDTLIIDKCNFTNISHAALLLNGAGYDKPLITNNTYTNCDYAGFFSNLSTVIINSDSANTTSGYYFSGIEYALPKDGLVSIKLYDITGRLVKQLVNEQKPMGRHRTTIESGNLASGIYIYSLRVNDININKNG
ncbi:MAG: T9SS type A sorting domain-containing protein [Ignavibacteriales bacterium]|nr:T9SS type A sorting domain-containing protein [Ignavibacteriales bacterium]